MQSRTIRSAGIFTITLSTFLGGQTSAQEPQTLPPSVLKPAEATGNVVPAAVAPKSAKAAPIDRFRNYKDLPELTRQVVFSTQKGMEWLNRNQIHLPSGRFTPGLDPALGKTIGDDNLCNQSMAAFALARAAKFTGDEKFAVAASQAILALLSDTPRDSTNNSRKPSKSSILCNRVGSAAFLALAIYELPDASKDLLQCAEELCQFIRLQAQPDGSLTLTDPTHVDTEAVNLYAGPALCAVACSARVVPADWKSEFLAKGVTFYRSSFRSNPNPSFVPWMTAACVECYLLTKEAAYAQFAFAMNDWLQKLQYDQVDVSKASWRGGFPDCKGGKVIQSAPTVETALYAQSYGDCCRLIRAMDQPDTERYKLYQTGLVRALQFLMSLQYGEDNTTHFASHFRPALVGAFHPSATDGTLHVEDTALAVSALTRFLTAAAD
jgi:hypothetical protein